MENVREMKSITLYSAIVDSSANMKEKALHMLAFIHTESKFQIYNITLLSIMTLNTLNTNMFDNSLEFMHLKLAVWFVSE